MSAAKETPARISGSPVSHRGPSSPTTKAPPITAAQYLTSILREILPRPDALRIEQDHAGDVTVLTIHVPYDDRRFVVGKRGRNIEAIRALMRAFAGRRGHMIVAKLPDEAFLSEVPHAQHHSRFEG